jgi:hypothetical protein
VTLNKPLFLQALSGDAAIPFSAQEIRSMLDALLVGSGVLTSTSLAVAQRGAGANFSVDVGAGWAAVAGTSVADQGKYLAESTATVNLAIAGAPGAGFSRLDLVYAQIRDRQADGGASYDWILAVATGVSSGVLPAVPANAIPLAQIGPVVNTTPSITTSLITDLRTQPSAAGFRARSVTFATSGGTTSAPFVGLTGGPQMTVPLLAGQQVLVTVSALASISGGAGHSAQMGFNVAGAASQAPSAADATETQNADGHTISRTSLYVAPSTGLYTFDTRYGAVNGTTATFINRRLTIAAA